MPTGTRRRTLLVPLVQQTGGLLPPARHTDETLRRRWTERPAERLPRLNYFLSQLRAAPQIIKDAPIPANAKPTSGNSKKNPSPKSVNKTPGNSGFKRCATAGVRAAVVVSAIDEISS